MMRDALGSAAVHYQHTHTYDDRTGQSAWSPRRTATATTTNTHINMRMLLVIQLLAQLRSPTPAYPRICMRSSPNGCELSRLPSALFLCRRRRRPPARHPTEALRPVPFASPRDGHAQKQFVKILASPHVALSVARARARAYTMTPRSHVQCTHAVCVASRPADNVRCPRLPVSGSVRAEAAATAVAAAAAAAAAAAGACHEVVNNNAVPRRSVVNKYCMVSVVVTNVAEHISNGFCIEMHVFGCFLVYTFVFWCRLFVTESIVQKCGGGGGAFVVVPTLTTLSHIKCHMRIKACIGLPSYFATKRHTLTHMHSGYAPMFRSFDHTNAGACRPPREI